jgi:hypothetical protein
MRDELLQRWREALLAWLRQRLIPFRRETD